ncbi:MAG: hypothetical protein ABI769_05900 [Pseudomonadota bacterium]
MMLVLVGGFAAHRYLSRHDAPSRDFTELELAGADDDQTGSCYSLGTVLIANRTNDGGARTWTKSDDGAWTLLVDDVVQSYGGPVRVYQKFTFAKFGEQVRLVSVDGSKGANMTIKYNVDELLGSPNSLRSTPVDRCLQPGATGYHFVPRR